jgi:hypothetical protein
MTAIRQRWEADDSKRDERGQRLFAARRGAGRGVGRRCGGGCDHRGHAQAYLQWPERHRAPPLEPGRVRRKSGGR